MLSNFKTSVTNIINSDSPFKYILSRILIRFKLSHYIIIKRDGYKIRFFPTHMTRICYDNKTYYRHYEESIIGKYLKNSNTYVDIGANIGLYALKAASVVGKLGKVYAFEPMPKIFDVLNKNIELNNFFNINTFNYAIGDRIGEVFLSDEPIDDSMNSIVSSSLIKVQSSTLDAMLENVELVNLLKIDVEGYELFVLKGAKNILKRTECVLFESWEVHFNKYKYSSKNVFEELMRNGFKIYKIIDNDLLELNAEYKSLECEDLIALKVKEYFKSAFFK